MSLTVSLEKVIFLDRDGVINVDSSEYIKCWEEFEFLPGSLEAMADLSRAGYRLILITNQSIIGRGMVPPAVLEDIHQRMRQAVEAAGAKIWDIFFCPHRPDEGCDCRKPEPGMIFQAKTRHGIDLLQSVMIGDNAKDVKCALNAGCGATLLVQTGCGPRAQKTLAAQGIQPTAVVADLKAAAHLILTGQLPVASVP